MDLEALPEDQPVAVPAGELLELREVVHGEINTTETFYRHDFPPPDVLAELDQLVPGAAKQILDTTTGQTRHRQRLENGALVLAYLKAGGALVVVLAGFGLVAFLAHIGLATGAVIIAVVEVIGIVAAAYLGRDTGESEDEPE